MNNFEKGELKTYSARNKPGSTQNTIYEEEEEISEESQSMRQELGRELDKLKAISDAKQGLRNII